MMVPSPQNILVRGTNWIGDAVMTLPALDALIRHYPEARITVLANPWTAKVYQNFPGVSEVLALEPTGRHKGITGCFKMARELAKYHFDLAVLFQNAFSAALITFLARIPERWGYAHDGRSPLLTKAVQRLPHERSIHESFYYLHLLQGLGINAPYQPPHLDAPAAAKAEAEGILAAAGIGEKEFLLLLAPGASYGSAKRWTEKRFAKAAALILQKYPGRVALLGSEAEVESARRVAAMLPQPCLNLAGHTSLDTCMAIMSRASLLLTNDSGLMHLGGALGVPLVAAFGPTNPAATGPLGHSRVIHSAASCAPCLKRECPKTQICFDDATPEKVAEAAISLLHSVKHLPEINVSGILVEQPWSMPESDQPSIDPVSPAHNVLGPIPL